MADLLRETIIKNQRKQRKSQSKQEDETKAIEEKDSNALTIIHTQGGFILLLFGLYIASVAIIGELLAFYFSRNRYIRTRDAFID